jgi:hypothetical protein
MKLKTEITTYARARRAWSKAGISPEDSEYIEFLIKEIEFVTNPNSKVVRTTETIKEGLSAYRENLQMIEKKYGLEDYCAYATKGKEVYSLQHGICEISKRCITSPLGINGKPGVGKTTLLNVIEEDYKVNTIDEFWEQGGHDHVMQRQELDKYNRYNLPIIVAAAQLEKDNIIKTIAFLQSDEKTRKHNLSTRKTEEGFMSITDKMRLEYFDAYSIVDNFIYGIQKINADLIIDASEIRY